MSTDDPASPNATRPPDELAQDQAILTLARSAVESNRAQACWSLWQGRHRGGILKVLADRMVDFGLMDKDTAMSRARRKFHTVWEAAVQYIEEHVYCPEQIANALQSYDPEKGPMTNFLRNRVLKYVIPDWFNTPESRNHNQATWDDENPLDAPKHESHDSSWKEDFQRLRSEFARLRTPELRTCFVVRHLPLLELTPAEQKEIVCMTCTKRLGPGRQLDDLKKPERLRLFKEISRRCRQMLAELRKNCHFAENSPEAEKALQFDKWSQGELPLAELWFVRLEHYEEDELRYRDRLLGQGVSREQIERWAEAAAKQAQKQIKDRHLSETAEWPEDSAKSSSPRSRTDREKFETACRQIAWARRCLASRLMEQKNPKAFVINERDESGQVIIRRVVRLPEHAEVAQLLHFTTEQVMVNDCRARKFLREIPRPAT